MQRHEELEQQRVIDGVLIGAGNCAITDDGAVISPSKMTVDQIRAELIARDLPIEGKRKEIYKRLQVRPPGWQSTDGSMEPASRLTWSVHCRCPKSARTIWPAWRLLNKAQFGQSPRVFMQSRAFAMQSRLDAKSANVR